jgi:hypothetical protein
MALQEQSTDLATPCDPSSTTNNHNHIMADSTSTSASNTRGQSATKNDELTLTFPDNTATTSTVRVWIDAWFKSKDLAIPAEALDQVAWDGQYLYRMVIPDDSVVDLLNWGFRPSYARIISSDIEELRRKKVKATLLVSQHDLLTSAGLSIWLDMDYQVLGLCLWRTLGVIWVLHGIALPARHWSQRTNW